MTPDFVTKLDETVGDRYRRALSNIIDFGILSAWRVFAS